MCTNCGSPDHETANCTAASGTGGTPDDSDLEPIGGASRSRRKTVIGAIIGLTVVGLAAGVIALRSGGDKATKAVATAQAAKPPTGDTIELGCSIPSVGDEVEARCDWARDGGVTFAGLRWDGDVLKGTIVVTLTDGRVYRSAEEMVVKAQKAKTPVTFLAQK